MKKFEIYAKIILQGESIKMIKKFETDRLIIRNFENKDYKDLYEYASDPEVIKFLHFKRYETYEDAKMRIKYLKEKYKENECYGDYAIELKEENKVIGSINIVLDTQKAGGIVALGWVLNKKYQGFGYMTECVKAALKYIKENKLAMRIRATHDVDNIRSGNVMKRVGMTFEGVSRKAGDNNYHSRYDVANYAILYEEIED